MAANPYRPPTRFTKLPLTYSGETPPTTTNIGVSRFITIGTGAGTTDTKHFARAVYSFLYRVYVSRVPVKISTGVRTIYSVNVTAVRTLSLPHVTSNFHREVDENCSLLCHYAGSSGNSLTTFQDNLLVPSSRIKILVVPKRR